MLSNTTTIVGIATKFNTIYQSFAVLKTESLFSLDKNLFLQESEVSVDDTTNSLHPDLSASDSTTTIEEYGKTCTPLLNIEVLYLTGKSGNFNKTKSI